MNTHKRLPHDTYNLVIRFLRHETSAAEIQTLEQWLAEDPSHRKLFHEINAEFQAHSENDRDYKHIEDIWMSLSEKIETADESKTRVIVPEYTRFSWYTIAASISIVLVAGFSLWRYIQPDLVKSQTIIVEQAADQKKLVTLIDGTKVWLNANSSIQYDEHFGKDTRTVLLKGEAFFDVTKTGIDFIVQTNNLNIRVKGTKFNVTAFNNDASECATLEEGRVVLQVKGKNEAFDMKPGDQVTFEHQSNAVSRRVVRPSSYSLWKEDPLRFQNATLEDILKKIQTRYRVTIKIHASSVMHEKLSMTLHEETLEEAMELIGIATSLKYSINDSEVVMYK
ncbi:FecR family protein [Ohtaekwangia kribbensis]|jgi:transmembrane sensor|uniref:FecR family protein n=1 Tax=Ohtaekwangia kribbensis TaxID=688913 RepID=A0ABW3KE28_9BACT